MFRNSWVPTTEGGQAKLEDLSKKILVESDSDGLSNLIRTLVNLFFVEISRFEPDRRSPRFFKIFLTLTPNRFEIFLIHGSSNKGKTKSKTPIPSLKKP